MQTFQAYLGEKLRRLFKQMRQRLGGFYTDVLDKSQPSQKPVFSEHFRDRDRLLREQLSRDPSGADGNSRNSAGKIDSRLRRHEQRKSR